MGLVEQRLHGARGVLPLRRGGHPNPHLRPNPNRNSKVRLLTGAAGRGLPSLTIRAELRSAPRTAAASAAAEGAVAGGAALGAAVAESAAVRAAAAAAAAAVLDRVVADDDAAYRAFLEEQRESLEVELAGMRRAAPYGTVAPDAVARRHEAARRHSVVNTRPST